MTTLGSRLQDIDTTKAVIRNAIIAKGVDVPPNTPFRQYGEKVAAIPQEAGSGGETPPPKPSDTDEWVRPADRPALPFVDEPEDNEIYMLFGVQPTGPNDYAITLTGTAYTAEWGDGTSDSYNSAAKAEHLFDYNSISVTPNVNGIKWVWIKFRPTSGENFTIIDTNVRHSSRPSATSACLFVPQVYEIYMKATQVTTWAWGTFTYTRFFFLESLMWYGTNKITDFNNFLYLGRRLQNLFIDTSSGTNFTSFLNNCFAFNQPLNINTSNGNNFGNFLINCSSFNQPLNIDTRNGTNFASFLSSCVSYNQPLTIDTRNGDNFGNFLVNCYSFDQPININTSNGVVFNSFLSGCRMFNQPINIDTRNGEGFSYFLNSCAAFNQPLNINTSKAVNLTSFLSSCEAFSWSITVDLKLHTTVSIGAGFIGVGNRAQTGLRLQNMGSNHTVLTISNSNLTAQALVDLFGDLYDRTATTAGTITITNCYGAAHLTPEQRAIATAKNWTIVG